MNYALILSKEPNYYAIGGYFHLLLGVLKNQIERNTPVYEHSTDQTIVLRHILISTNVLRSLTNPILLMSKLTSTGSQPFARSGS